MLLYTFKEIVACTIAALVAFSGLVGLGVLFYGYEVTIRFLYTYAAMLGVAVFLLIIAVSTMFVYVIVKGGIEKLYETRR